MIVRIQLHGDEHLAQITATCDASRFFFARDERRQEQSPQNSDYGNNDKQLDERESIPKMFWKSHLTHEINKSNAKHHPAGIELLRRELLD